MHFWGVTDLWITSSNPCAYSPFISKTPLTSLDVKDLPEHNWLITADVTSLYTVILNISGIHATKEALHEFRPNPHVKPSNDSLIQLLEFVLAKNKFKFNGQHYLQVGGTSMDTKDAPSYAKQLHG